MHPKSRERTLARNPQSEVTLEPQPHQYPTAQLSALLNQRRTRIDTSFCVLRTEILTPLRSLLALSRAFFRSAYMIVRNRQDSEDIVQDTLVQAWGVAFT